MNWIERFLSAFRESEERRPPDEAAGVAFIGATLLSDYLRLSRILKLLYGLWAAVAIAFVAVGLYATSMRLLGALGRVGTLGAWPLSVTAILLLGGAGLLYECVLGVKLDARAEGYVSRFAKFRMALAFLLMIVISIFVVHDILLPPGE